MLIYCEVPFKSQFSVHFQGDEHLNDFPMTFVDFQTPTHKQHGEQVMLGRFVT